MPKDTTALSYEPSTHTHTMPGRPDGITVIGEAVRRVLPESAEFVLEIGASAPGATQALRDARAKTDHLTQTLAALGVQPSDLQTLSVHVYSLFAPGPPALMGLAALPTASGLAPELQFGSYHARTTLRVHVRDAARVGEIVDAATRAGGMLTGGFSFRVADEAQARRAALEAAGRDARAKAETLAAAAGKQIGDPVALSEDVVASNGVYAALRAAFPLAFGPGSPPSAGELEYYARVSAAFRLQ